MHREQTGNPSAPCVFTSHQVPRAFGRDHKNADFRWWFYESIMDAKAMRESQILAGSHGFGNLPFVHAGRQFIGNQHHDDVGFRCRLGHWQYT